MSFNKAKALKTASKYVQQGKYQSAIEEYRQVAEADPSDVTILNTLGDLYVKVGQTSEAIVSFLHIAEHYRISGFNLKAIAMLKKVSKVDAGNMEVSLKLAGLYAQQKLIVDARHQYLSVAEHYIREGQTQEALEIYQKIADLDPENTAVQLKLAEAYLRENLLEKAHDTFTLAANELRRQNKELEALPIYLRAIRANPRGQAALAAAVHLYLDRDAHHEAIELIESLLADRPNDVELLTLLARIHQSTQSLEEAEAAIEKVLLGAPSRYQYALDLALLYLRQADVTGALRLFDRVIENLYEYREEEKAAHLLREILAVESGHLGVLTRLATVYEHTHDDHLLIDTLNTLTEVALQKDSKPAAISALQRLLELEPDEIQHRRRLRELEETDAAWQPEPAQAATTGNYEPALNGSHYEATADFSDYAVEIAEDDADDFASNDVAFQQEDNWSISTVAQDEPSGSLQDFGSFAEETQVTPKALKTTAFPAADSSLRDELESVDFYLMQGMLDVARYTLESAAANFPDHPEVQAKFVQLREAETKTDRLVLQAEGQPERIAEPAGAISSVPNSVSPLPQSENALGFLEYSDIEDGFVVEPITENGVRQETEEATIFMVPPATQAHINHLTHSLPTISEPAVIQLTPPLSAQPPELPTAGSFDLFAGDEMGDLLDFLDEFKAESEQHKPVEDFETHYNLGLAYKEMDMFDEAIEEFQQAFKGIMADPRHPEYVSCCNMLAFCFAQKGLPRLAVVWLKKALESPGRNEDVYQALRYDLADAYAAMGEIKDAYEMFAEVYAIDVQYRSVKVRMQELAAQLQ
jgi:tetratricopeptide (TPR) repeat protein